MSITNKEYKVEAKGGGAPVTDAQLDPHLDAILRGGGSALKHYSMAKSKEDMRNALRRALAELGNA